MLSEFGKSMDMDVKRKIAVGGCIWTMAGENNRALKKHFFFHASVMIDWGTGAIHEAWFGNNDRNPCIEICEYADWNDDEEIKFEKRGIVVVDSTPRKFLKYLTDIAISMGPYNLQRANCHDFLEKVLQQHNVPSTIIQEFRRYNYAMFAPMETKPPHSPSHSWISPVMAMPDSPSPLKLPMGPDPNGRLQWEDSDSEDDDHWPKQVIDSLRRLPWGLLHDSSWEWFEEELGFNRDHALAILQADHWPTSELADGIRLIDDEGNEIASSRAVSLLKDHYAEGKLLVLPNEAVVEELKKNFRVAGVDKLKALAQDCSPDLSFNQELAPAYQVVDYNRTRPGYLTLTKSSVPQAAFSVARNQAVFKKFMLLDKAYGAHLGPRNLGLRAHMAFVLASAQSHRCHNPVYKALRSTWMTSSYQNEEFCDAMLGAWEQLLSPRTSRSLKLNKAIKFDTDVAEAYSKAAADGSCVIA